MQNIYAFFTTVRSLLADEGIWFYMIPDFLALLLLCLAVRVESLLMTLGCLVLGTALFAMQTMTYAAIGAGGGGAAFTLAYLGASLLVLVITLVTRLLSR